MPIQIIKSPIDRFQLRQIAKERFGDLVKGAVEFDSMINIKPNLGNRTRGIDDEQIRDKMNNIVSKLIK